MAIERPVLIDGAVMSHHEVTVIAHIANALTTVDVMSWVDSSKAGNPHRETVNHDLDDSLTFAEAEEWVASLPIYEEYIDPNKEAVDELLPILTDEQAEQVTNVHPSWEAGVAYAVGKRVKCDGKLYRCVQAHTSQIGWEPPITPALWVRTVPDGDIPDWVQPTGAQDGYGLGDKVKHNGSIWESNIGANVWEPGIYGWTAVNE